MLHLGIKKPLHLKHLKMNSSIIKFISYNKPIGNVQRLNLEEDHMWFWRGGGGSEICQCSSGM